MSTFYLCHSENLIFLISPSSPPRKRNLSSSAGRSAVDRKEQWTNSFTEWECLSDTSAHAAVSIYHWLTVSFTFTVWLDPKYNDPVMMWHWAINQIKSFGNAWNCPREAEEEEAVLVCTFSHILYAFAPTVLKLQALDHQDLQQPSTSFTSLLPCFPLAEKWPTKAETRSTDVAHTRSTSTLTPLDQM